jgi:hypothetical protein
LVRPGDIVTEHPTHDPEFDAVVEELQRVGFVTIGLDAEGDETWTLTPTGEQIALQMSMSSEDDAAALLEVLPHRHAVRLLTRRAGPVTTHRPRGSESLGVPSPLRTRRASARRHPSRGR